MKGKRILLGISGGIAAYKCCALVRLMVKAGAHVQVILTPDAAAFVSPLTLSVLSKNPVIGEISRPLIKKGINKISKSIGLGVKHDKHPTHQFLYSNLIGGVPMSNNEIKNMKVGGSFAVLGTK